MKTLGKYIVKLLKCIGTALLSTCSNFPEYFMDRDEE